MTTRRELLTQGSRQTITRGLALGALALAALGAAAGCDAPAGTPADTEEVTAALQPGCTAATLKPTSATASSLENNTFPAKNAIDGSATTRWSSAFSDPQSITVDYGATVVFSEVKITWQNSYAKNYVVQVSNAANGPWTQLYAKTGFGGGTDDTAGLNGVGRYLQIYGTKRATQYGYSIFEIVASGSTNVAACGPCTPGAKQCSGNGTETCQANGVWGAVTSCGSQTCVNGTCSGCTPGAKQCSGNGVQTCQANGTWGTAAACNNQACVSGACTGVCAPAAAQCSGLQVETCSAAGQWSAPTACPVAGAVCDVNACVDVASVAAPTAYYPLEGNVKDTSGNGYHGLTATNVTTVAGKLGNAFSFNGGAAPVSELVQLGSFELTHPSPLYPAFTMCMWFNAASLATSGPGQPLFSIEVGTGFAEHLAIQSAHPTAGTCGGANQIILTDAQSGTCQSSGLTAAAGWNHLCYGYDYGALQATFTLNGVQKTLSNATTTLEILDDAFVGVAQYSDASVFHGSFKGTIDEVGLWGSVLSSTDVKALYDSGKGAKAVTGGAIGTGPTTTATQVAAGTLHTCARLSDGTVSCWGDNSFGQLGTGSSSGQSSVALVVPNLTGVKKVAVSGEGATCVLFTSGGVKCWGLNISGEIGQGTSGGPVLTPTTVPGVTGAADLQAGGSHFCVLLSADASVQCWGSNQQGQLGIGTPSVAISGPKAVVDLAGGSHAKLLGVASLANGGQNNHMCAVLTDGTAACWGDDEYYQLGLRVDGTAPESCLAGQECSTKPMRQIALAGTTVKGIGLGLEQTCLVYTDGRVACMGTNPSGQTGQDIGTQNSNTPAIVAGVSGATSVVGGANHTCALVAGGAVECWGDDNFGELGNVDSAWTATVSTSPVQVNDSAEDDWTFLSGVTSLTAGKDDTCVVTGGLAECWGYAAYGETGLGFATTGLQVIPSPVQ